MEYTLCGKVICGCLTAEWLLCTDINECFRVFIWISWPLSSVYVFLQWRLLNCFLSSPFQISISFLASTLHLPASLKVTTSSATLPQILAKQKINNKSDNLLLCLPACRHNNHQPILNRGGVAYTLCVPALSSLCIFWMKPQVQHLPVLSFAHCSDSASEGKSDLRLGIVGVTLCHTGSAFWRRGGCLQREEVSQAVVDGGRARQEEAESSFHPFWIFYNRELPTSSCLQGLRERVGTEVCI